MANWSAFLVRRRRVVRILLAGVVCLGASALAQHGGGGGGHGGGFGGHFGGGHSSGYGHSSHSHGGHSGGHSAGHWGWLHFGSHGRNGGSASRGQLTSPSRASAEFSRGLTAVHSIPPTYIGKLPFSFRRPPAEVRFKTFPRFRHRPDFFREGFRRFHSSGCFFNGFTQVCFFEPAWPLYDCYSGLWIPFDFAFGDEGDDSSVMLSSADAMPLTIPEIESEASPPESAAKAANNPPPLRGLDLDPRFFLLILKNGAEHVVTDYWLADGYIEYVSRDGTQSHIPVESLDGPDSAQQLRARA
jgi:hypothetical protein